MATPLVTWNGTKVCAGAGAPVGVGVAETTGIVAGLDVSVEIAVKAGEPSAGGEAGVAIAL